tara:strand:+ start:2972 stop:3988 length:1017 start_codon:yes stop_codon:yes gene_type:complete
MRIFGGVISKMKVAVCKTKPGTERIWLPFAEGVVNSGDSVEIIETDKEISKLEECDVSFQVGEATRYETLCFHADPADMAEHGYMRILIKNKQIESKKPRMILDCGLLRDHRKKEYEDRYFSIGVNGVKGRASFYNENSPGDRWKNRKIRIKERRQSGDHILVVGQTHYGAGLAHVGTESDPMANMWTDPTDYYENMVRRIREYTDRPILFRTHPIGDKEIRNRIRPPEGIKNLTISDALSHKIEEDLKNAWCTITRTSNGAIDSILEGVPVITEDPVCMSYDVSEHSIKNIEHPFYPSMRQRSQWLYNLAYAEWSLEEMKQGLPWQHLRSNINANIK